MHANNMTDAQRGQAIVETVMFLPMFLFALFGVIWTVQAAVQYERAQSAVRYSGLIAQSDSPYNDYSLYSVYSQLPLTSLPALTCSTPQAVLDALSDASPTFNSAEVTTASPPFWSPSSITAPTQTCPTPSIVGIPAGTGLAQDVLLTERNPSVTSHIDVPAAINGVFGTSLSSFTSSGYFFRTVGVNTILGCYGTLKTQVKYSLNFALDTSSGTTAPAALSSSFTVITLSPRSACSAL